MEFRIKKYIDKLKSSSTVQIGSSIRPKDFTPYSDYDFLAIYDGPVRKKIIHKYISNQEIDVVRRSKSQFIKLLKAGSPFDLVALNRGKILKDDGFFAKLRQQKEDFKATIRSAEFWIYTASWNLSEASFDYICPTDISEYFRRIHHAARDFSRAIIFWREKKLVEGNDEIIEGLTMLSQADLVSNYNSIFEARVNQNKFRPRTEETLFIKDSGIGKYLIQAEKFAAAAYRLWNISLPKVNCLIRELIKAKKLSEDVKKNSFCGFWLDDKLKELTITFITKEKAKSFIYDLIRSKWKEE